MTDSTNAATSRSRGRLLAPVGLGVAVLAVAAYAIQLSLGRLMLPWYMPAAALLGIALVGASVWMQRTVWRVLALVVVVLLAGLEFTALSALRLPAYAGPITVGHPFPAFGARRADGTAFTQSDLIGDKDRVLVFFRGRW